MAQQFTYMAMQMQLEEVLYKQRKHKYTSTSLIPFLYVSCSMSQAVGRS